MKLLLRVEGQDSQEFIFDKTNINIGKSKKNHIVLDDDAVDDIHIMFKNTPKGVTLLEDNHTRNGTFVNSIKIKHHHLMQDGDIIRVAKYKIVFYHTLNNEETNLKDDVTVMISNDFQKELQKELSKNDGLPQKAANNKVTKKNVISDKIKQVLGL